MTILRYVEELPVGLLSGLSDQEDVDGQTDDESQPGKLELPPVCVLP